MVLPFLAFYLVQDRGFSQEMAAWVMGAFGVGSAIAANIGGTLADRIGRRPVMIGALVGAAITILLVPRIEGQAGVLAAVAAFALASEAYRPAGSAMLGDMTVPELRARAYALFYAAINLGFTVGAAVGGWLVVATSYDTLFVVEAVSALVFAMFIGLWLPETHPGKRGGADAASTPSEHGSGWWVGIRHVASNRPFVIFVFANLLIGLVFNQSFSTLPMYFEDLGIAPDVFGRVMAVNGVLIVLGQLPLADRLSRYDRGHGLVIGALFLALGFGLQGAFRVPLGLAGCVLLWTVGEMFLASLSQPVVNDLAPTAMRARYFGAFTMSFGLAMSLGPPLGSWILVAQGPRVLWLSVGGLALVAALLLWSIRDHLRQRPAAVAQAPDPSPDPGTAPA